MYSSHSTEYLTKHSVILIYTGILVNESVSQASWPGPLVASDSSLACAQSSSSNRRSPSRRRRLAEVGSAQTHPTRADQLPSLLASVGQQQLVQQQDTAECQTACQSTSRRSRLRSSSPTPSSPSLSRSPPSHSSSSSRRRCVSRSPSLFSPKQHDSSDARPQLQRAEAEVLPEKQLEIEDSERDSEPLPKSPIQTANSHSDFDSRSSARSAPTSEAACQLRAHTAEQRRLSLAQPEPSTSWSLPGFAKKKIARPSKSSVKPASKPASKSSANRSRKRSKSSAVASDSVRPGKQRKKQVKRQRKVTHLATVSDSENE